MYLQVKWIVNKTNRPHSIIEREQLYLVFFNPSLFFEMSLGIFCLIEQQKGSISQAFFDNVDYCYKLYIFHLSIWYQIKIIRVLRRILLIISLQ